MRGFCHPFLSLTLVRPIGVAAIMIVRTTVTIGVFALLATALIAAEVALSPLQKMAPEAASGLGLRKRSWGALVLSTNSGALGPQDRSQKAQAARGLPVPFPPVTRYSREPEDSEG